MPRSIASSVSVDRARIQDHSPPRRSRSFSLESVVNSISLSQTGRGAIPNSADCQLAGARGHHHRDAHAHAMSTVFDVLSESKGNLTRRDKAAVDFTLRMIGRETSEHYGNHLLVHLTALGAVRAGISEKLDRSPNDPALLRCMRKLSDAIIDVGIKAGKCKTVADGGYHADGASRRLTTALKNARDQLTGCVNTVGGPELLESVARALLAEPLMNSINERQGNPEAFRTGEVSPMAAIHKQMADDLQCVVREHLDNGGPEHFIGALTELIKVAEYVVEGDPGRGGAPERPARDVPPHSPAVPLDRLAASGSPINYQYAPINVDSNVSDLVRAMREQQSTQQPLQIVDIQNFGHDQYLKGVDYGMSKQLNAWQASVIAELQEKVRQRDQKLGAFVSGDWGSGMRNRYEHTAGSVKSDGYDSVFSDSDYQSDLGATQGSNPNRSSDHGGPLQGEGQPLVPHRNPVQDNGVINLLDGDPIYDNVLPLGSSQVRPVNSQEYLENDNGDGNGRTPFDTISISTDASVRSWLNNVEDPDQTDALLNQRANGDSNNGGGPQVDHDQLPPPIPNGFSPFNLLTMPQNPPGSVDNEIDAETDASRNGGDDGDALFDTNSISTHASVTSRLNNVVDPDDTGALESRQANRDGQQSLSAPADEFLRLINGARGNRVRPSDVLAAQGLQSRGLTPQGLVQLPDGAFQPDPEESNLQRQSARTPTADPSGRHRVSETLETAPHRDPAPAFGMNRVPMPGAPQPAQPIGGHGRPLASNASMDRWLAHYGNRFVAPSPPSFAGPGMRAVRGDAEFVPADLEMDLQRMPDDGADDVATPEINAVPSNVSQLRAMLNLDTVLSVRSQPSQLFGRIGFVRGAIGS